MQQLPIHHVIPEIKSTLNTHNRVILQAPPGAGKTTAVPVSLLDQPWLQNKQIIMLEPRRLAARNAAYRMAYLLNEKPGQSVGYQIRQDNCFSDKTRILVVTEGILTRKLQADPELKNTALVIFDEFHERSLNADLSLALCLQSQQILNENLKILVMSATLNTNILADLLEQAPVIQSEGRSYDIKIHYLETPIKQTINSNSKQQPLIGQLVTSVKVFIHEHQGNCLIFLPGVKEINLLAAQIRQYLDAVKINEFIIAPLHGNLSKQQQDKAIQNPADNIRKIVLATNIAETSLTIEGISCVIDSGLERVLEYNPASGMDRLKTQFITQDSANQRSGRAGRLKAGHCYRLWTSQQQQRLVKHTIAELLHSDLSSLVLELANWGVQQVDDLQWLDTPPKVAVEQAKSLLIQLDAIDSQGKITDHGRHMLKLGTHPRLAHMMLSSIQFGQAYHACLIASILTEKDLYIAGAEKSYDIESRLKILQHLRSSNLKNNRDIDKHQCNIIMQTTDDFYRRLKSFSQNLSQCELDYSLSGVILAHAYPDRIAQQRDGNRSRYLLSSGKGAYIPEHLQHHLYEFIVIATLSNKSGEACIYLASEITELQIESYFKRHVQNNEVIEWNDTLQRVEANQVKNIGQIVLQKPPCKSDKKNLIHQCLMLGIRKTGLQCLNWSEQAQALRQRVEFINYQVRNQPNSQTILNNIDLPDFSDASLLENLQDWLAPHLSNESSIKQLQRLDMNKILLSQLSWDSTQLINHLAPEKINVPSGSSIRIDYSDTSQPILAVRLQEVFGLNESPSILNGHCQLMMHLLSPAHRPMQVTQDLNSFWKTTYHDVKKELRGKYKKHFWPDDPFTAKATSKTRKNM